MALLRPFLPLVASLALACRATLPLPAWDAQSGPAWPVVPDPPRVVTVGAIDLSAVGALRPLDVACSPGEISVADPDLGAIWRIDLASGRVRVFADGIRLPLPVGVAYGARGDLVVVDAAAAALYSQARPGRGLEPVAVGPPLVRPTDVAALGPDLLVVDTGGHRLYTVDPGRAELVPHGPGRGGEGVGFNYPVAAAVAADGAVYVVDGVSAVVHRLSGSGIEQVCGGPGVGGSALVRPKGLALDGAGRLHVVDAGMQHVQVYRPDGALEGRYGEPGAGPGQLALPGGVCIQDDLVFVADSLNRRIQVYRLLEPP